MPQDANLILPSAQVVALSPVHKIIKKTVNLDPDDSHWLGGSGDSERRMLAKAQIEDLFNNAGGEITQSTPLPTDHPNIVRWQCQGTIKTPDGTTLSRYGSYSLDLRYTERPDDCDGTLMQALYSTRVSKAKDIVEGSKKWYKGMPEKDADWADWLKWARDGALTEIRQIDRFRDQRAESGAMLRVCRQLLSLKSNYTRKEIERPWIVYTATFDMSKAMQLGGHFGDMATRAFSGMLVSNLGLSQEYANQLLLSAQNAPAKEVRTDLLLLNDQERDELEKLMLDNGWKDRRLIDQWMEKLFGESFSSVTKRHAALITESLKIMNDASERMKDWTPDSVSEFKEHIRNCTVLAFSQGESIVEVMDQEWYDLIYGEEEIVEIPTPDGGEVYFVEILPKAKE